MHLLYLWECFQYKISTNKHAIISKREIVSLLSAHGELSSELFTGGIRFPSFFNSEHLWRNPIATLNAESILESVVALLIDQSLSKKRGSI